MPALSAHLYVAGAAPRRKLVKRNACACDAPSPALKCSVRVSTAGAARSCSLCVKPPREGALSVSVAERSGCAPTTSGRQPSCSTAVEPGATSSVLGTLTSAASHETANVVAESSGFSTSSECVTSWRTVAASAIVETIGAAVAFATTA